MRIRYVFIGGSQETREKTMSWDELKSLSERSKKTFQLPPRISYSVQYDNNFFSLYREDQEYHISPIAFIKYSHMRNIIMNNELQDTITREITRRINLPRDHPEWLPIMETPIIEEEKWDSTYLLGLYSHPDIWMSLMIDQDNNEMVGIYYGHVLSDNFGQGHNELSRIEIRRDYRGRHLCIPFATFTYHSVVETYQITHFIIHNNAQNKVQAAYSYGQAGFNNGYKVYINKREVTNKDDYNIFLSHPQSSMEIIIPPHKDN